MDSDYGRLVRQGYDKIAQDYLSWREQDLALFRDELDDLANRVRPGASILDVGCGPGIPFTRYLSERFAMTGVDLSEEQINLARRLVPNGTFLAQNMLELDVPPASFDAVICMYALIHVPRIHHAQALANMNRALAPSGYLLLVTGNADVENRVDDFFGSHMYWSHYDRATSLGMIRDAGFEILWDKIISDRPPASHVLALARKKDSSASS